MNGIKRKIDRCWRVAATGFCFAFFFLGGLFQSVVIFPLLRFGSKNDQEKSRRVRAIQRGTFRFFVRMMEAFGLIRVCIHNPERLQKTGGTIVVANHPTLIDVVILLAWLPQANCVVKGDLWRNRFLGGVMRSAGFINNESGDQLLKGCQAVLDNDEAVLIFPEGSRSVPGEPLQFKRGTAQVAVRTNAPITTVFITCEPITLTKGEPWYHIPPRRADINLYVEDVLVPKQLIEIYDDKPAAARLLTRYLQNYYEQGLKRYG